MGRPTSRTARSLDHAARAAGLLLLVLALPCPAAWAAPVVRVRAATRIELGVSRDGQGNLVSGRLLDDQGQPLGGQPVLIGVPTGDAIPSRAVQTGELGEFSVEMGLPSRDQSVTASFAGSELYGPARRSALLRSPAAPGIAWGTSDAPARGRRPSSLWLLVPVGVSGLVLLAWRGRGRRDGARARVGDRSRDSAVPRNAHLRMAPEQALRARAGVAFQPVAMALLPSVPRGCATPAETWAHASRSGAAPPELAALVESVELACYGPEAPDEARVGAIEAGALRVAESLPTALARAGGSGSPEA